MAARAAPSSAANPVGAGAVGVVPSTHSWTPTSTGCEPGPATSATPAPVATARHGRGIGTPAANTASSRRTGPSNASTLWTCRSRLNAFTANRPRLVENRPDRCIALGPLVMATSGPVGTPSPKASAIDDGEISMSTGSAQPWSIGGPCADQGLDAVEHPLQPEDELGVRVVWAVGLVEDARVDHRMQRREPLRVDQPRQQAAVAGHRRRLAAAGRLGGLDEVGLQHRPVPH